MRILFIADVVGTDGRRAVKSILPAFDGVDLVIANGENAAGGLGITPKLARELFRSGVHVITTGNHLFRRAEIAPMLDEEPRILRPQNFRSRAPGKGYGTFETSSGVTVGVLNLVGQLYMDPADDPVSAADAILDGPLADAPVRILDFHAEATAEKQAMGFFLDGRVSAVLGTHTHVQTSDLRILDKGTAYQSDVGMTGSLDSVIGMRIEPVLQKFLTGINHRFEVEKKNLILDMTVMDFDKNSGKAIYVEPVRIHETHYQEQLDILN